MIIVCNSCSTQYSVNDAKVRGKLVRITCKHCASAIVVDGRQMSETEVAVQKPLSGYALPRRDESVVAAMPNSLAPGRSHSSTSLPATSLPSRAPVSAAQSPASAAGKAPVSAPKAPVSAPMQSALSAALREEDQTMVTRSRFGDDMSVHDERTVIGQIPKEALEFERMFAQRTQPPPPGEEAKARPPAPLPAPAPLPSAAHLPKFPGSEWQDSEPPAKAEPSEPPAQAEQSEPPEQSEQSEPPRAAAYSAEDADDETKHVAVRPVSVSEPPTIGALLGKSSSDVRGLVSMAEATHPSVARSVSARRWRVTLVTLVVLGVLAFLFVSRMPHKW